MRTLTTLSLAGALALCACNDPTEPVHNTTVQQAFDMSPKSPEVDPDPSDRVAEAQVRDATGKLLGTAVFIDDGAGVELAFEAQGLPGGEHGFHLHEKGDCSSPDFKSAGGHFAPMGSPHAGMNADRKHVGDLGNLDVPEAGAVSVTRSLPAATLAPEGKTSLLAGAGTALVIHAGKDDGSSQPSGDAGARIACGVVTPRG